MDLRFKRWTIDEHIGGEQSLQRRNVNMGMGNQLRCIRRIAEWESSREPRRIPSVVTHRTEHRYNGAHSPSVRKFQVLGLGEGKREAGGLSTNEHASLVARLFRLTGPNDEVALSALTAQFLPGKDAQYSYTCLLDV